MKLEGLYAARAQVAGMKPSVERGKCAPWLKVERDEAKFGACMKIAEAIGTIDSSKKAHTILADALGNEDQEVFGALYLDTHLQIRGLAETGRGEMDRVMAPIAPTLRIAIADGAQGIIIWHTHPTMLVTPSEGDKLVTADFAAACRTVSLLLVDHIIIGGKGRYYSFLDAGELQ
jgi:DNA repair protein RadC